MKCVWKLDGTCQGKVSTLNILDRGAFAFGLSVHICESHKKEHENIMALYEEGYEPDEVLLMSAEKRKELLTKKENENEVIDN